MSHKNLEQEVSTIGPGTFASLVPQASSVHLISQIQSDRIKDEDLRSQWFWGGDGVAYGLKGEDVILYLTDAGNNPGFEAPELFAKELIDHSDYFIDPAKSAGLEAKADAPDDDSVVAFNLSELERKRALQGALQVWYEYQFINILEVSTDMMAKGRKAFEKRYCPEVTALVDRVHGKTAYGKDVIGALLSEKDRDTIIYVLNNDYVKNKLAGKKQGTMLARASVVDNFDNNSFVYLLSRNLDYNQFLRGVINNAAEGGDSKEEMMDDGHASEGKDIPDYT